MNLILCLEKTASEVVGHVAPPLLPIIHPCLHPGVGQRPEILWLHSFPDAKLHVCNLTEIQIFCPDCRKGGDTDLRLVGEHAEDECAEGRDASADEHLGDAHAVCVQGSNALPLCQEGREVCPAVQRSVRHERAHIRAGRVVAWQQAGVQPQAQEELQDVSALELRVGEVYLLGAT